VLDFVGPTDSATEPADSSDAPVDSPATQPPDDGHEASDRACPEGKLPAVDENGKPLCPESESAPPAVDTAVCPLIPDPAVPFDPSTNCPRPGEAELTVFDGTTITYTKPQRFDRGSSRITPSLQAQLGVMARRALAVPQLTMVVVEAYADTPGATDQNEALADDRANAIRQVLLDAGLPIDKVTVAVGDLGATREPSASQFEMTVHHGRAD